MSEEIKVHVIDYGAGRNLMMRYLDPNSSRHVAKTTGTRNRTKAERAAAKWEAELREGRYQKPSRMEWSAFREYYVDNALAGLAENSIVADESTLNAFKKHCSPNKLGDLTTERVTEFTGRLRKASLREATVARHLRHLKATARWAHRKGLLPALPVFDMPKRAKGAKVMRGRPVTGEEFERMIANVAKVVENAAAESWKFFLHGLWTSGLRLTESLTLRWDEAPGALVVDFTGRRPMFRIPAEAEKGNQDRLLPVTPDFAAMLQAVPERERRGRVFKLLAADGSPFPTKRWNVGRVVSAIGKSAGVVVDERRKGDETVRKFASAHDLRRAFGFRWAIRVMPAVLQQLMRHADVQTTMKYYVGQDAEAMADAVWAAAGNTLGNTESATDSTREKSTAK
ncbi:MAG: tyrosine-type recombinase/integrase [Pirellulales bacterium]